MLPNRQMKGSNDIHIIHFFLCFTFVLLILSDTFQMDYETIINEIINKTNIETIVFDNGTCRESVHYYYKRIVCMNSSPPDILQSFLGDNKTISSKLGNYKNIKQLHTLEDSSFPIEYYNMKHTKIGVRAEGILYLHGYSFGEIEAVAGGSGFATMQIINNQEVFAVRWSNLTVDSNGEQYRGKAYSEPFVYSRIEVPSFMIKSYTTVHFTPTSIYCAKQTSNETCLNASTVNITCYWCPKIGKCSNGADVNANEFVMNGCFNSRNSPIQVLETTTTDYASNKTEYEHDTSFTTTKSTEYAVNLTEYKHIAKSQTDSSGLYLFIVISAGLLSLVIAILFVARVPMLSNLQVHSDVSWSFHLQLTSTNESNCEIICLFIVC
ncbi:Plexin domain-containing protein [Schistosoma japonicum]|nr:Plexin domain-containing protein [Schistosoma japonicum]